MKKLLPHITALIMLLTLALPGIAESTMYIDIIGSPRKLPVAVMDLEGPYGKEIADIIRNDLFISGVFSPMDPRGFTESISEDFDPGNWVGTGAEAVIKGSVESISELVVTIRLYDVVESRIIMEKKYRAGRLLKRPLAHAAANDIYEKITGQKAIFRTKMAYVTATGDMFSLNISDWDGMRARTLNIKALALLSPHWTPDGRSIAYTAARDRKWSIYSLDLAVMKEETLLKAKGTNMAGDFLPNGKGFLTLSSSAEGSSDIYIYDIKKKKLKRLTRGMGIEVSPTVSPDSKQIAYVSDRSGSPQIYTMDIMGYNKSRVTFQGSYNTSPVWSPTGNIIAFCGQRGGRNQIFTIWPDGSGIRMLTELGNNEEPSFSPDGRMIAFTSDRDGKRAVYIMRVDGSEQRRISSLEKEAFSPRWAPR